MPFNSPSGAITDSVIHKCTIGTIRSITTHASRLSSVVAYSGEAPTPARHPAPTALPPGRFAFPHTKACSIHVHDVCGFKSPSLLEQEMARRDAGLLVRALAPPYGCSIKIQPGAS